MREWMAKVVTGSMIAGAALMVDACGQRPASEPDEDDTATEEDDGNDQPSN